MIQTAEIINQPYSGEYDERIYDNISPWNSSCWTWVKFTEGNKEWCGQFRGERINVALSLSSKTILILTSDYLFAIDINSGDLINSKEQTGYINLTAIPSGDFLVSDYYSIEKISKDLMNLDKIPTPIEMDNIKFQYWQDEILYFTCDEFLNYNNENIKMIYNSKNNEVTIF